MKQLLGRVSLVGALALGLTALGAAPSNAAAPAQSCATVKGSATFSPGLTNTPANQTIKAKGTETKCKPSAATGGSGALTATIKLKNASCTTLINGGQTLKGTGATAWKNGQTSNYTLTFKTGTGNNITVATITGKVSSGLFAGDKISGQIQFTVKGSPDCNTKPVKQVTFVNTKPFVIG